MLDGGDWGDPIIVLRRPAISIDAVLGYSEFMNCRREIATTRAPCYLTLHLFVAQSYRVRSS